MARQVEEKKQTPSSLVGGILYAIFYALRVVLTIIWTIIIKLGLWIPGLYALFGVGLYLFAEFNPLNFNTPESNLYIIGFGASCLCMLIISVRNLIIKPVKGMVAGFKEPFWKKGDEQPRVTTEYVDPTQDAPRKRDRVKHKDEKFKVYKSELEPGAIIHEYSDRFEVYIKHGNKEVLDKVEYKID